VTNTNLEFQYIERKSVLSSTTTASVYEYGWLHQFFKSESCIN